MSLNIPVAPSEVSRILSGRHAAHKVMPQTRQTPMTCAHDLHTYPAGTAIPPRRLSGMSDIRRNARDAKAMLGRTGTIHRVAAFATLYEGYLSPDDWVVETLDDGGVYVTVFSGPQARERAFEYAEEKYSGVQLREPDRSPHK
jgi:hypothetical protein